MLLQLILVLIVVATAAAWGAWLVTVLDRFDVRGAPTLPLLFVVGLVTLTLLTGFASLFIPLSPGARAILLALSIVPGFAGRKKLRLALASAFAGWGAGAWLAFAALGLIPLAIGSSGHFFYDTGLYHAQSIRWLHEHGTVIGLGNLHDRLAYVTSFWPLAALFSPAARGPYPVVPALLLVLSYQVVRWACVEALRPLMLLVAVVFFWFYLDQLGSPAPDVVVGGLVVCALLLALEGASMNNPMLLWAAGAAALLAASVKPTAAPALLLAMPALLRRGGLLLALAGAGVAMLTAARSVILSGYLAYPILPFRFPVDWSIPEATRATTALVNRAWALMPRRPPDEVFAMPAGEWFTQWVALHGIPIVAAIAFGLLLSCAGVVYLLWSWRHEQASPSTPSTPAQSGYKRAALLGFILAVTGTLFWFFTAPDPRFGAAYPLCGYMIAASLLAISRQSPRARILAILTNALLILPAAAALYFFVGNPRTLLRPGRLPEAPTREARVGSLQYRHPILDDRCFAAKLPCAVQAIEGVELRGAELGHGFRSAP